jgi:hypothetical protein
MKNLCWFFLMVCIAISCTSNQETEMDIRNNDRYHINVYTTPVYLTLDNDTNSFDSSEIKCLGSGILSRSFAIQTANLAYKFGLTHGDTIGIFPENDYQIPFALPIPVGPPVTSSTMLAEGWSTKSSVLYAVYLPWKFENRYYNHIPWDNRTIQKQKGNDNTDSISNYWLLASDTLHSGDGYFGARLINMGTMVRCQVKSPCAGTFSRMIIATDSKIIPTHGYYDLFDVSAPKEDIETSPGVFAQITSCPYLHQPLHPEGYTDHITLDMENVSVAGSNVNIRGWFLFPECDLSGKNLTVYLYDNLGNCYTSSTSYASKPLTRSGCVALGFSNLVLTTTPFTNLNPWETDDLCQGCSPVAF